MTAQETPLLIVDDDPADREFVVDSLKIAGVLRPIRTAEHGRQAIDYLSGAGIYSDRKRNPLPCLIITDLKMPLTDGFELLDWVRRTGRMACLPVLMLSGSSQDRDVERAYAMGANGFLVKPVSLTRLADMMAAVKAYWLDFNLAPAQSVIL